jgi:hypothetical protein
MQATKYSTTKPTTAGRKLRVSTLRDKLRKSLQRRRLGKLKVVTDDKLIVNYVRFQTTLVFRGLGRFSAPGVGLRLILVKAPAKGRKTSLRDFDIGDAFGIVLHRTASGRFIETCSGAQFLRLVAEADPRERQATYKAKRTPRKASVFPTQPPPPPPPPPPRPRRRSPPSERPSI